MCNGVEGALTPFTYMAVAQQMFNSVPDTEIRPIVDDGELGRYRPSSANI